MNASAHLRHFDAAVRSLPPKPPTLRDLWLAASDADDAVSAGYREGLGEFVMDALENAASDARAALVEHLRDAHGLTCDDLRRGVL